MHRIVIRRIGDAKIKGRTRRPGIGDRRFTRPATVPGDLPNHGGLQCWPRANTKIRQRIEGQIGERLFRLGQMTIPHAQSGIPIQHPTERQSTHQTLLLVSRPGSNDLLESNQLQKLAWGEEVMPMGPAALA